MNESGCLYSGEPDYKLNEKGLGYEIFHYLKLFNHRILQYLPEDNAIDTYEDFLKRSIKIALFLQSLGITNEDVISICSYHDKNTCVPFVATQFICAQFASFDINLSIPETIYLITHVKPKVIFVAKTAIEHIEKVLLETKLTSKMIVFGQHAEYASFDDLLLQTYPDEDLFCPKIIDDLFQTAAIFFSSGTTGLPKGVRISHYNLIYQAITLPFVHNDEGYSITNKSFITIAYASIYWISCIQILFRVIFTGGARVVCSEFNPEKLWHYLDKYKIDIAYLTPYQATNLIRINPPDNINKKFLKSLFIGSASISENLMMDLRQKFPTTRIIQIYGQTEGGGIMTHLELEEYYLQEANPLTCGKLAKGFIAKVVDLNTYKTLGSNQEGELCYKTTYPMNKYINVDAEKVYDDDGFLRTGDIVYYDENNCLYICGRYKDTFKYKNWHMNPLVLENIMLAHPAVKEAVVIGIPHGEEGEHPMGVAVLNDVFLEVTGMEIEKFVEKEVLERQRLRAGVKIIKAMPRTVTDKINRNKIRTMVLDGLL